MRLFARILILQVLKGYQLYNTWFWTPKYWRVLSRRPRLTNLPRYDINIFWALQNKLFFHLADELLVVPLLENWNRPLPFWPNGDFFINSVEEHWFIRNGFWLLLTVLKIIAISHMEITISLSRSGLSCSTYRGTAPCAYCIFVIISKIRKSKFGRYQISWDKNPKKRWEKHSNRTSKGQNSSKNGR